jgi:hypothetical protein
MFLRDRQPSQASREWAFRLRAAHFAGIVVVSVFWNLAAFVHLLNGGTASWIWIQLFGLVVLAAAIVCLVLAIRRVGLFRPR